MLKAWMLNPDLGEIEIEEKFKRYSEDQRKDKFVTVPWLFFLVFHDICFQLKFDQLMNKCLELRYRYYSSRKPMGVPKKPKTLYKM